MPLWCYDKHHMYVCQYRCQKKPLDPFHQARAKESIFLYLTDFFILKHTCILLSKYRTGKHNNLPLKQVTCFSHLLILFIVWLQTVCSNLYSIDFADKVCSVICYLIIRGEIKLVKPGTLSQPTYISGPTIVYFSHPNINKVV